MVDTLSAFFTAFGEFGPGWLLVAGLLALAAWITYKLLNIYEKSREENCQTQKELVKTTGQMIEQMDRSSTVIESVQHEMSTMTRTNQMLVETLTKSIEHSETVFKEVHEAAGNAADNHDKIDMIYHHLMTK